MITVARDTLTRRKVIFGTMIRSIVSTCFDWNLSEDIEIQRSRGASLSLRRDRRIGVPEQVAFKRRFEANYTVEVDAQTWRAYYSNVGTTVTGGTGLLGNILAVDATGLFFRGFFLPFMWEIGKFVSSREWNLFRSSCNSCPVPVAVRVVPNDRFF